ncbi:MAG: hypothetical protein A3B25_02550 [Candidatus Ryanbacteria bacterium RIFCSPLOWO2_01_FULL_48_26]|uniref:Uncharacterized protein n=1 Tax=Candidatus Ryanbacteria bacterium RIFCSPLOWO2_01_FULL_48_26 TaxID=1802126 RepID=A0A1G2GW05_9BACT|nr:MAG: hypothetical protein A3B25_02550 [Candidatus Ryanbacteria bacterium RIFCSPLOWO2_01_FULL_48_26]
MKNVLIKASGDVKDHSEFRAFVAKQAKENYVVVIPGAGTQASRALKAAGYVIKYDAHGRVTSTWEERKIVRDAIEKEAKELEDAFVGTGIVVTPPILYAGSVLCHINADNLVKAFYLGFDEIYVFTLKERAGTKEKEFANYPKVKVISLVGS